MVDVFDNLSEVTAILPESFAREVSSFILVLKAVGVAFIIYVIYIVIKAIMNLKRYNMLKRVNSRVDILEDKIDLVLDNISRKVPSRKSAKKSVKKAVKKSGLKKK